MTVSEQIKGGLITNNPVLVQLIGMCPTLATSTSLTNGIGMGLSATAVLVCSNIVISLLRKIIPSKIRIAAYITIIAGFVTIIDLLLQAFIPSLAASLGLFIPLIVVNWAGLRHSHPRTLWFRLQSTVCSWVWASR